MAYPIVLAKRCAHENIDAFNRSAKAESALNNGAAVTLAWATDGYCFTASAASTISGAFWMALSPEVNKAVIGSVYGGADPRYFRNEAGRPFDVVKLVDGDVLQVTADFFSGTPEVGKTAVLTSGAWTVGTTSSGTRFSIVQAEPIVVGMERVPAWNIEFHEA